MVAGPQLRRPGRRRGPAADDHRRAGRRPRPATPDLSRTNRGDTDDRSQPAAGTPDLTRRRFLQGIGHGRLRRVPRRLHRHEDRRLGRAVDRRRRPAAAPSGPPPRSTPVAVGRRRRRRSSAGRSSSRTGPPTSTSATKPTQYTPGASPTLEEFKKKYNVEVDYEEKIGDNAAFVETIKPALVGNLPTGWDLVVLTDWMAAKIVSQRLGREDRPDQRPELHRRTSATR